MSDRSYNRTGLTLLTAPTFEPIKVETLRDHCRVEHHLDDPHMELVIIPAARAAVERYLRRALVKQTWKLTLSAFPHGRCPLELPYPPLATVDEFKYYDVDGTLQTFTASDYVVEKDDEGARLFPAVGTDWPDTQEWRPQAVMVTFTCGIMQTEDALTLPPDYRAALLLWAAHMYENREPVVTGTIANALPFGIEDLLAPTRALRF